MISKKENIIHKEYIECESLIRLIRSIPRTCGCDALSPEQRLIIPQVLKIVNGLILGHPTADVVEVTYCKDCSHCDPENKHCDHPMGTSLPVPRKDTDFCSYGVRKDE